MENKRNNGKVSYQFFSRRAEQLQKSPPPTHEDDIDIREARSLAGRLERQNPYTIMERIVFVKNILTQKDGTDKEVISEEEEDFIFQTLSSISYVDKVNLLIYANEESISSQRFLFKALIEDLRKTLAGEIMNFRAKKDAARAIFLRQRRHQSGGSVDFQQNAQVNKLSYKEIDRIFDEMLLGNFLHPRDFYFAIFARLGRT